MDVLIPSDSMIFRTSDIGIKSAVEVLRRLSCHGGSQLAAYGIRHIAARIVYDILGIVCDSTILSGVLDISAGIVLNIHCIVFNGALFSDIGDILRSLLRLRGRARRIRDFRHGRILGIDLKIRILPILVLNLDAILCRSDFHIGLVAVLVSHIAIDVFCGLTRIGAISLRIFGFGLDTIRCHIRAGFCPVSRVALLRIGFAALFRMGELALRGHTALFHLSVMSDTVCGNRSRAIMNRTIRVRLLVFHGNLAYIELAIDRQIFLYGDIFLKFCFAFCGQCAIERGLFIDTERAIDLSILEAGFTSHIERAIHIRLFELGIACDRERLIHGHVALELRSIFHFQRACVHSARRGDIASASIYAFAFQLAIRSHIAFRLHVAKVIDSHIAFDRSFVCSVIAFDSGGALIGRSNGVRIFCCLCIQFDQIIGYALVFLNIVLIFGYSADGIFTILNFLVDLLIQCCIGCNAIFDLRVDLLIQRRIGCNAIFDLRVNLSRQFRIFRFQTSDIRLRCRYISFQRTNIRLRCCHICLHPINIRFGSRHTTRKVSQGCLCGSGLGIQILNSLFIRSNFRCITSDLTIQLSLCCSNLFLEICLRRSQCIRSGKFTIRICFRVYICRIGFQIQFFIYLILGIGIVNSITCQRGRFVCLALKRCFDYRFIHFVIHSSCKIIQRVFCSECGISKVFTQFIIPQ